MQQYNSRAEIAALTSAQAYLIIDATVKSSTALEGWKYYPDSKALESDGLTIVPSDRPISGRWIRVTDYAALVEILAGVVSNIETVTTTMDVQSAIQAELAEQIAAAKALAAAQQQELQQIDAANAFLAEAVLNVADGQQSGAIQYQEKINKISAATDTATANIIEESKVAASATQAVAQRTMTIETQLYGIDQTQGSVSSSIQDAATAYVAPLNALAESTQQLQALVGGSTSSALFKTYTSAASSGAVATTVGSLTATDGTHTATVGYEADAIVEDGIVVSQWRFVGDRVLFSPAGGSTTATIDPKNARIVFNSGSFMLVEGTGFGASNQFSMWFGPSQAAIAACTEANGIFWLKTNGDAYFGGTLSAGILKNANQSSSIAADAYVETGSFASHGGIITVTLSYSYTDQHTETYAATSAGLTSFNNMVSILGLVHGTGNNYTGTITDGNSYVDLYRSINGGSYALVTTLTGSGGVSIIGLAPVVGDSPGSIHYNENVSGSLTYTDPRQIAQNRQYKAVLRTRSVTYTTSPTQTISIICTE